MEPILLNPGPEAAARGQQLGGAAHQVDDERQPPFVRQPRLRLEEGDLYLLQRRFCQTVQPRLTYGHCLRMAQGGLQCVQRLPLLAQAPRVQAHGVEVSRLRSEVRGAHADDGRAWHGGQAVRVDVEQLCRGCLHNGAKVRISFQKISMKKKYLQKQPFQRQSPPCFLPDMSVFPTVHLRSYTPMDYRTCVGLVSEESRRWYVVELYLLRQ